MVVGEVPLVCSRTYAKSGLPLPRTGSAHLLYLVLVHTLVMLIYTPEQTISTLFEEGNEEMKSLKGLAIALDPPRCATTAHLRIIHP